MLLSCDIQASGYDATLLQESLLSVLETNTLCSMSTSNGAIPYINTAYFAYASDLKLYFLSQPTRQHSLNLAANPNISLTVFNSGQPWGSLLQGLQIFGECILTNGHSARLAFDLYSKRFVKLLDIVPSFADYERGAIQSRFYEIRASRVKIFDEPRFGKDVWISANIANKAKISKD